MKPQPVPGAPPVSAPVPGASSGLYPSLNDFMGLDVSEESIRQHVPNYVSIKQIIKNWIVV